MNKKIIKKIKERGSIVIYTVMILSAVIMISLTLLKLLVPKFLIVRESVYSTVSFYAADSGMEWCLFSNRNDPLLVTIPPKLTGLQALSGATISYYSNNAPTNCTYNAPINYRTVGTYNGISRSLEIF